MPALFFGSISTIADTSEIQREAFNDAFQQHGLDWKWDRDEYRSLLQSNGGADRVAQYAADKGQDVDAAAVHKTKSELYQQRLHEGGLSARPGVAETLREAKEQGYKVAFVTTTARENVSALLDGTEGVGPDDFDLIISRADVDTPKPDGAVYDFAIERIGASPDECVAVEDNVGGVQAAKAGGVRVIAFPNENTAEHDFDQADKRVDRLAFSDVQEA